MKILGSTPGGYVVEVTSGEMNRLVNFRDGYNSRVYNAGEVVDVHSLYEKAAAISTAATTLDQVVEVAQKLATKLRTPPAAPAEQAKP